MLGGELHQRLEELAARERVEAGDGLIEHEQLGSLCDRERERELRTLPPGERAGALPAVETEPRDPLPRERSVPARVERRAQTQVLGHRQRWVQRRVLRDEADPRELRGSCRDLLA